MRSVLAELGIAIPVGIVKALWMAREIVDGEAKLDLPAEATNVVALLAGQLLQLHVQLRKLDLRLAALQRSDDRARRQLPCWRYPTSGGTWTSSMISWRRGVGWCVSSPI